MKSRSVSSRLFNESIHPRNKRKDEEILKAKEKESEEWALRLAAECHLVDSPSTPRRLEESQITRPSLNAINIRSKRKTKKRAPCSSRLMNSPRRSVSVILSNDGSVCSTTNYICTDSVEPPPFNGWKPQPIRKCKSGTKIYQNESVEDVEAYRNEFRKLMPTLKYYQDKYRLNINQNIEELTSKESTNTNQNSPAIIQDTMEPLDIDIKPKATPIISTTVNCWEHSGYPNSLSFILDK